MFALEHHQRGLRTNHLDCEALLLSLAWVSLSFATHEILILKLPYLTANLQYFASLWALRVF